MFVSGLGKVLAQTTSRVAVALGVRGLSLALLGAVFRARELLYFGDDTYTWAWVLTSALGWGLVTAAGAFLWVRDARAPDAGGRAVSTALAVTTLVALAGWHHSRNLQGFLGWFSESPYQHGRFPYEAGRVLTEARSGYEGTAHIGPNGFRTCGPDGAAAEDALDVSLIGDSMVFGLVLDDEDTLCWSLREHFAASDSPRFVPHNHGQPGANVHSYARTLAWVHERYGVDVAVVGLFIPDDAQAVDLNRFHPITRHPLTWVASAILEPEAVMTGLFAMAKFGRAELFDWASLVQGMEDLAATSERRRIPTLWFLWDGPWREHRHGGMLRHYDDLAHRLAEEHTFLRYVGVLPEDDPPPGEHYRIPNDGHPTAAGIDRITPVVAQWLEQAAADGFFTQASTP